MSADVICLDVLNSTEVWHRGSRISRRSNQPQLNAARSLRAMGIPDTATIHYRRFGHVVRAALLGKILEDAPQ
jgi:hypothetical protein